VSTSHEVTQLLRSWTQGDARALDQLIPLVYDELHRAASSSMSREAQGHTLQATALIHEVYLRLVDMRAVNCNDRAHFLAICAQMMRRILTDWARKRRFQKRGGGARRVAFDEALTVAGEPEIDLVALDDALSGLAAFDPRKGQVVELRFYGGLTAEETASVLKTSVETVARDWRLAKLWLLREMSGKEQLDA
jgi:RNA polymerase sigma factor (TIGR02999 family)